jgi:hypothetical protein
MLHIAQGSHDYPVQYAFNHYISLSHISIFVVLGEWLSYRSEQNAAVSNLSTSFSYRIPRLRDVPLDCGCLFSETNHFTIELVVNYCPYAKQIGKGLYQGTVREKPANPFSERASAHIKHKTPLGKTQYQSLYRVPCYCWRNSLLVDSRHGGGDHIPISKP